MGRRTMPPLNPLRVFAVVAQTRNLTAAAQELNVTQSAVSRQIGVLEGYLGVELFKRERHGVALTRRGQAYAAEIVSAFEAIATATGDLTRLTSPGKLRVRTYTTFAAKWLIPRLPDFKRQYPEIDVKIITAVENVDFDRDAVDVAIQFGDGTWPRMKCALIAPDRIEPVCSSEYLARLVEGRNLEALLRERLLVSHFRRSDWDDWLGAFDLEAGARGAERMVFSSSVLSWQAATDGLGLAMGQASLLVDEYRTGRLVRPFGKPLQREKGHYLVWPEVRRESRNARCFRTWLAAAARESAAEAQRAGA